MLDKLNGSRVPSTSQSIRNKSSSYSFKQTPTTSPFLQQLKTFEDRINKACKTASKKYKKQSKQYSLYSAFILKQTKQMINQGSCMRFCDPNLLKLVEDNNSSREKQKEVLNKVRNFRARSIENPKWKQGGNTSILTQKPIDRLTEVSYRSQLRFSGKQNQVTQNLKTFLNHKKKPLKQNFKIN